MLKMEEIMIYSGERGERDLLSLIAMFPRTSVVTSGYLFMLSCASKQRSK